MTNKILIGTYVAVLAILVFFLFFTYKTPDTYGSITQSQEYNATSTAASSVYGATITGDAVIKSSRGSLGSVVITGANTGIVNLYDATTTDVNKRTGQKATSTILIASLPASLAAGTYVFDMVFTDGLLLDVVSGSIATSTITYR